MTFLASNLREQARTKAQLLAVFLATVALANSVYAVQTGNITTTIYAGRYFEVREHDAPVKYVFKGETRVASVVGSLSGKNRVQRIRLFAGWNLCSFAVSGLLTAAGGQSLGDLVSVMVIWDSANQGWKATGLGESLTAGTVVWIEAKTDAILIANGGYADPVALQVSSGGTYLPSTGLEVWSPVFPPALFVWFFNAQTGQWQEELADGLASFSNLPATLAPGQALYVGADVSTTIAPPDPVLRIKYYHQDHIGSSSVMTDADGMLLQETAFYPFGLPRSHYEPRNVTDPYQFTQKERDRETGLDYFEARYLSSTLGRFISVDPAHGFEGPAAYTYGANNPVRYVDPTGLDPNDGLQGDASLKLSGTEASAKLKGSDSIEGTTSVDWYEPIKYKYRAEVEGRSIAWSSLGDIAQGHYLNFKGSAEGSFNYNTALDTLWTLRVPFEVSAKGGLGTEGLDYSGTVHARYSLLAHHAMGLISMSFHGNGLSVPEYTWRQWGIGFYPKINAGSLPVPPPEQAFNATKMDWSQGVGLSARYVKQWKTSRLELVGGIGVGLNEQNVPSLTPLSVRATYYWGQSRSWSKMPSELSENAGLPQ
jgi:RHS repeat-associated protein